jgi:hypothetical protein
MRRFGSRAKRSAVDMSTALFVGPAIGFFGTWLSAEALLAARPHPLHWGAAFAGGAFGWMAAKMFYRSRRTGA